MDYTGSTLHCRVQVRGAEKEGVPGAITLRLDSCCVNLESGIPEKFSPRRPFLEHEDHSILPSQPKAVFLKSPKLKGHALPEDLFQHSQEQQRYLSSDGKLF